MSPDRVMKRALVLARRGMGRTRPNPPVGAVLIRGDRIVGEGFHEVAGSPHAEIRALETAGERARGATLFVTLEPCNHRGRTAPCVPALIRAGVDRVVVGTRDPNPGSGKGLRVLQEAGIAVSEGVGGSAARHLVAGFASLVERERPRITLKMAASLDGRISTHRGESRWISSPIARAWVHRRRREADAVLVGAETALRDNPALTVRAVIGRSPDRIVLDSRLRVSPGARVWAEDGVRRVAVATEVAPEEAAETLREKGVEVWTLPSDPRGRVSLPDLGRRLGTEGYTNVMVEGGGVLAGALLETHLVDIAHVFLARGLLLGGGGRGWTEGLRVPSVPRGLRISRTEVRSLGPDWLLTLVPEAAQWWDPEPAHV